MLIYTLKKCFQCIDRGCTSDITKTMKKRQAELIELYLGPEFLIDFRYA